MIISELNSLYKRYGYRQFKMTNFETYDLYADNRDFLRSNQVITFTDLDGSLMALKPDVTLSIIKFNRGSEEKVFYNENVYRPKDHRYKEILQAGIECIGNIDSYSEAEVIALAAKSLRLISDKYVLRISDAAFLKQMFDAFGLGDKVETEALRLFSMKDAAGFDKLVEKQYITEACANTLKGMAELYMPFREGVRELKRYAVSNVAAQMADHLAGLSDIFESFGVLNSIYLDFSVVNSMDYYNGILFQGAIADIPFTVLSGGRYDKLPEKMGKHVGAIGFALYLDTVENYLTKPHDYDVDYLIIYEPGKDDPVKLAAAVEALNRTGCTVRSIRQDEIDKVEHSIKSRKILRLQEAVKEAAKTC
ncbi:MAG: ATP phosphoribosyltransferase regulatory subunit [Lachnospiraceae bacterium]|nr:ATP phosphoribosyltransferase regulatory subunit [Lachnospiraceae bacterium]